MFFKSQYFQWLYKTYSYQTAYADRTIQAGGGDVIFRSNIRATLSFNWNFARFHFYICHTALRSFPIVAACQQTHLAFLFRNLTTGQPPYCDYLLKGMLDAVYGPCQPISQFSRNMQQPVYWCALWQKHKLV